MPKQQRFKTKYPGVYFIAGTGVDGKPERVFYIQYRKDGKLIEEKAGRQFQDDMTAARAAGIRTLKIRGDQPTNEERREAQNMAAERWTIARLWEEYKAYNPAVKAIHTDEDRYNAYLKMPFGGKEPKDRVPLDVDRVRIKLQKTLSSF